jgi:nitrilase
LASVEQDGSEWLEPGGSLIVDPKGNILAGPAEHEETILYAVVDLSQVHAVRRLFDTVGHYNRPDVFTLTVDTRERNAAVRIEAPAGGLKPGRDHRTDR